MSTYALMPAARQPLSRTTAGESHNNLLRLLARLELTPTEVQLAQLLVRSTPQPVRVADLAAAVTGCPDLNRRQRAVLEQQIAGLRSKLMGHGLRLLCVERYGYLLLPLREE